MQLYTINTGYFKLDGGAMFGVVPKTMWQKLCPPDEKNLCTWAMRCLLIESGNRLMLIDTGIGNKQNDKFRSHFEPHGADTLHLSLQKLGFHASEITDVLLTHLHFDHCGGAVELNQNGKPKLTFPNATYWTSAEQWFWALDPNPREQASFLKENILPIQESGQLKHINPGTKSPFDFMEIIYVDGHTDKQMLPVISYMDKSIVFCADLLPSVHHIPIPWVMAYDTRPLLSMKEKSDFLDLAIEKDFTLFFEHDATNQCAILEKTEKGIRLKNTFGLTEIL